MRRLLLLALAALTASCAAPPRPGYRDSGRQISSMVLVEPSRLDGSWAQVAGFAEACPARPPLEIRGGASQIRGVSCLLPVEGDAQLIPGSMPGRYRLNGAELWLLWVDYDYRTLVIGTPSGAFGAVLNRGGPIPADRLEAARRILAFNGYDISQLKTY